MPYHGSALLALGEFGNAFAEKLTRRRFDRSEVAACNAALKPSFLIGVKCDRHGFLYHKSRAVSTAKPAFIMEEKSPIFSTPRPCSINHEMCIASSGSSTGCAQVAEPAFATKVRCNYQSTQTRQSAPGQSRP